MTDTIPWPIELQALIREGYRCRQCRVSVLEEHDRRIVLVKPYATPELINVATMCLRCARSHDPT